jgi:hypothetical protein
MARIVRVPWTDGRPPARFRRGGGRGADAGVAAYGKLARGTLTALRARIGMEIGRGGALVWEPGDPEGQTAAIDYLNGRVLGPSPAEPTRCNATA